MAGRRDRIFGTFGAILFLLTSSTLTIAAIAAIVQQNNQKKAVGPTAAAGANKNQEAKLQDQANQTNQPKQKLTGTKMAGFTPVASPQTKLEYIDIKVGSGPEVKPAATVTADYVGALMKDGTIFDASADHGGPISFPLNGVIKGWTDGIPGMKVGGTRRLLIPAAQAYGAQSMPGIPANSDLVFDVTITAAK